MHETMLMLHDLEWGPGGTVGAGLTKFACLFARLLSVDLRRNTGLVSAGPVSRHFRPLVLIYW